MATIESAQKKSQTKTKTTKKMKLNILTTAALLAMAGALMTQSAKAQFNATQGSGVTGTGNSEDLILSFTDPVGTDTGTATNYELDLGQYSTFANATSTINIANIASDLGLVYGTSTNFFSNANLQVGILGVNNSGATSNSLPNTTLLVSDASTTPYTGIKGSTAGQDATAAGKIYTPGLDTTNVPTDGSPVNGSSDGAY